MGMECHDDRASTRELCALKSSSDHGLMPKVDAIKNPDRKVCWSGNGIEFGDIIQDFHNQRNFRHPAFAKCPAEK
jgi:hypothetical protein